MTHTLQIEYEDEVLLSAGLTRNAFDQEARFLLAAKLYEMGRLSSGQAATLCGMDRVIFSAGPTSCGGVLEQSGS